MVRLLPRPAAGSHAATGLLFAAGGLALGTLLGVALVLLPPALAPVRAPRLPVGLATPRLAPPPTSKLTALPPGRKFPPLTPPWLNGPRLPPLAPARGRVTVVDVWAMW